ncbi:MAG TPA: 3'(2'),5'-bisphosphate nucleotidase CysQ [Nitrospirota bacterium]|nr:3'(2'),5'-bisphosphate nucleotidase CysQ [Nitrospirota bacterium]
MRAVLRSAGSAIMDVYRSDFSVEQKSDESPVTLADRRSAHILSAFLKKQYPFPILSEEGESVPYEVRRTWETFWLIDPLDGTKEFIKGNGEFTINVALVHRGRSVLGIIYVPVKDVLYYASQGDGAFKVEQGTIKRLPSKSARNHFVVVGSRSHTTSAFEAYVGLIQKRFEEVTLVSAGSALKFCLIAEGAADVYPRHGHTMEWDTAAGQVIVEEAGGTIINAETGGPLYYAKENLVNPHFIAYRSKDIWTSLEARQS